MDNKKSFKFLDEELNHQLIDVLRKAKVKHDTGKDGMIHYCQTDVDLVENDLICSIRDKVFPSWQVLTCPDDWTLSYKNYMSDHRIPFREEFSNGQLWFLIPRNYRPHLWKLATSAKAERIAL